MRLALAALLALALCLATSSAAQAPAGSNGAQPAPDAASQRGDCPPGQTEVRPGRCQAPELAPPSIVDYRPKSSVVAIEHKVARAKFPVVDIHSHQPATPENMDQLATGLVGTRSPYGACSSVFDPERISGGSSSRWKQ